MCNLDQDFSKTNDGLSGAINLDQDFSRANPELAVDSKILNSFSEKSVSSYLTGRGTESFASGDYAPNAQIQKDWGDFRDKNFKSLDFKDLVKKLSGDWVYADERKDASNGVKDKTNEDASSSGSKNQLNYSKGGRSSGGKGRASFSKRKRTKAKGKKSQINKLMVN